jgi:hypothetical protein
MVWLPAAGTAAGVTRWPITHQEAHPPLAISCAGTICATSASEYVLITSSWSAVAHTGCGCPLGGGKPLSIAAERRGTSMPSVR